MTTTQRCCFVLWGDQCDEAAAALFVTGLRGAGLRVWVVGVSGKRISGAHGLRLLADLALDEALPLAPQALCVAIPCTAQTLAHFLHDPRLRAFLQHAVQETIPLYLAAAAPGEADALTVLALPAATINYYPAGEALLSFIQAVAVQFAAS
jgi:hypothetical protein